VINNNNYNTKQWLKRKVDEITYIGNEAREDWWWWMNFQ